ncbi:MAG TPA: tetratricopeptide repeat protein [Polyangia bacterium]|nr:tetratricopeptide repeat protein [Polyangia bacterium]
MFSAGFVAFDDDFQVYANPFLNPPTLSSVGRLWAHAYQQLYVPLAYTIFAVIAGVAGVPAHMDGSTGNTVSLDPAAFHLASVALHVANAWLCFSLVRRLTGRTRAAWISALVFALHPLQVESVAWISELRGLTSAAFALGALNAFVVSRQATDQARARPWLAVSPLLVASAMLCKPSAAALPLVALAIDRVVFRTSWRKALATGALWLAVIVPFVWITRSTQGIPLAGQSSWWQRPFVAGDSLAFYLFKTAVPVDLGVDYGRTPRWLMSHGWAYLTWVVPVALLVVAHRARERRPLTWLGALSFLIFLLPTSGLVPFAYQAYSTVADRYAYLALIGVGLVISEAVEQAKQRTLALRAVVVTVTVLGVLSFSQSRHWVTSPAFLAHTIDVNPDAAFAYSNRGDTELANGDPTSALADLKACVEHDPTRTKAYISLAEVYTTLNQPAQAEEAVAQAMKTPDRTSDDFSNLGIVLMKMDQPARALEALSAAVRLEPSSPTYLFNQANALSAVGRFEPAEAAFRRCIALAPTLAGAHTGLGIVLAETQRLPDAVTEFRTAVRLQPDDPSARDDLKRAEDMLRGAGP